VNVWAGKFRNAGLSKNLLEQQSNFSSLHPVELTQPTQWNWLYNVNYLSMAHR